VPANVSQCDSFIFKRIDGDVCICDPGGITFERIIEVTNLTTNVEKVFFQSQQPKEF
jgi:hypothetical protein